MNLGLVTESFSQDRRDWLQGAHGTDIVPPATLDVSKFTAGTHYPDGYIKSGIPLGKITTGGKYGPYDDTATDGRQTCVGFLYTGVEVVTKRGQVLTSAVGSMLVHCAIKESKLPVSIDANGKADLGARVIFV
ncbi:phage-like protein [Streptomyces sp. W007]|uniref:head decoration protein n=1 Tax=Streptomyces sp. W007 TaxID=1055352 RepID=UPI000241A593|nr:head decoration protein [Streptomyces sp. W007]EHM24209.1 phage-like protein [Streptomyces sp. W007]